jgi:hypothetical protein
VICQVSNTMENISRPTNQMKGDEGQNWDVNYERMAKMWQVDVLNGSTAKYWYVLGSVPNHVDRRRDGRTEKYPSVAD